MPERENLLRSSDDRVTKRKLKAFVGGKFGVLVHPTKYVLDSTSNTSSDQPGDEFRHPPSSSRPAELNRAKADIRLRLH